MRLPAAVDLNRETAVSAGVNAAFSAAFFLLIFGPTGPVSVWGLGNYAIDFVPQSIAIALMATLVPGLLARRALRKGRPEHAGVVPALRLLMARAASNSLAVVIVGAGLCAATLYFVGAKALAWLPAFAFKVVYGAAVGALVTRTTLAPMLEPIPR